MRAALLFFCLVTGVAGQYTIRTAAGSGVAGFSGDGETASRASLNEPVSVALHSDGRLYIADSKNNRVRRVDLDGRMQTVGEFESAVLDVAVDGGGKVYAATQQGVRVLGPEGWVELPEPRFESVRAIAVQADGTVLVASGSQLQRVEPRQVVAEFPSAIVDIAIATNGTIYVVSDRIYRLSADWQSTPLETGVPVAESTRIAVDPSGDLFVSGFRVWKIAGDRSWVMAGLDAPGWSGDGGPSVLAAVNSPSGLAADRAGNIYFADTLNHRVRVLRPPFPGSITAVVPAARATEIWPRGVTLLWTGIPGATAYEVWFGKLPESLAKVATTESTIHEIGDLEDNTTYYWRVKTKIVPLPEIVSPLFTFTTTTITGAPPAVPDQPSPLHLTTGVPTLLYLNWKGSGARRYDVFIGEHESAINFIGSSIQPGVELQGLRPHTRYYWRVVAVNDFGATSSRRWQFTTGPPGGYPFLIETVAGTLLPTADGGLATESVLRSPGTVAADGSGNVYFIEDGRRVRLIGADGRLTTIYTPTTDGPTGLALDSRGNLYVSLPDVVIRMSRTAQGTVVAGRPGRRGFSGEGGLATMAEFDGIAGITIDSAGTLYIADQGNHRVRSVSLGGQVATVAGNGLCEDVAEFTGAANTLPFCRPAAIATDGAGNLYVSSGERLIRIAWDGTAVALPNAPRVIPGLAVNGSGQLHLLDGESMTVKMAGADGAMHTVASGPFTSLSGITFDSGGRLLIADSGNHRIYRVDASGVVSSIGGLETTRGDRGNSTAAFLLGPSAVAVDRGGTVYIADTLNQRVRRVTSSRYIDTVAGGGASRPADFVAAGGTPMGVNGQELRLNLAGGVSLAVDDRSTLLFSNAGTSSAELIGIGSGGSVAEYLNAHVKQAGGLVRQPSGDLYVSDTLGHRILRIASDGTPSVIAGTGAAGFTGDGGPASLAQVHTPGALSFSRSGDLYVAEFGRIRRITPDGRIMTVIYEHAKGLAHDPLGNLFFTAGRSVYTLSENGQLLRLAGRDSSPAGQNDNAAALDVRLSDPRGIAVGPSGEVVFADAGDNLVRRLVRNVPYSLSVAPGQANPVNAADPFRVGVIVRGRSGVPVPGVNVQLSLLDGGSVAATSSGETGVNGIVTFRVPVGTRTGNISLRAAAIGIAPLDFTITRAAQ